MADLPESIPNQLVKGTVEATGEALTLVRKVFADLEKPNGVIFKTDEGQLVIVLIKEGKWDWENVLHLNMDEMLDKYDDISAKNPFEFVFIKFEDTKFTTTGKKTVIPNTSMLELYAEDRLKKVIETDYENQYGNHSV